MMRLLAILVLLLSLSASAQKTTQSLGTTNTLVVVRSDLKVDSLFYLPQRDTNFTPSYPGAVIQSSDNGVYVWNTYWRPLAGGVDSVYSRGDSLFYYKGGAEYFVRSVAGLTSLTVPDGMSAVLSDGVATISTALNGLIRGTGTGFAVTKLATPLYLSNDTLHLSKASADSAGYLSASDWSAFNAKLSSSRAVNTQYSLTGGGALTTDRTLSLVNDLSAPGNLYYYGTNGAGVKGWYALPSSTPLITSVFGRTGDIVADVTDYEDYYAPLNHGHVSADISDLTSAVRNMISGGAGITYNANTGVISFPGDSSERITSINGLTATDQTLRVDSSGTDFNIVSVGAGHTFNLPTASATKRGVLSINDWVGFNAKASTGYVDSSIAAQPVHQFTNGLTNTSDTVRLGGALTGSTTVAVPNNGYFELGERSSGVFRGLYVDATDGYSEVSLQNDGANSYSKINLADDIVTFQGVGTQAGGNVKNSRLEIYNGGRYADGSFNLTTWHNGNYYAQVEGDSTGVSMKTRTSGTADYKGLHIDLTGQVHLDSLETAPTATVVYVDENGKLSKGSAGTSYTALAPLYINSGVIGIDTTTALIGAVTKGRLYKALDSAIAANPSVNIYNTDGTIDTARTVAMTQYDGSIRFQSTADPATHFTVDADGGWSSYSNTNYTTDRLFDNTQTTTQHHATWNGRKTVSDQQAEWFDLYGYDQYGASTYMGMNTQGNATAYLHRVDAAGDTRLGVKVEKEGLYLGWTDATSGAARTQYKGLYFDTTGKIIHRGYASAGTSTDSLWGKSATTGELVLVAPSDLSGGTSTDTTSLSNRIEAVRQELRDTAAAIRADFPAGGGSVGTLQQVTDAGATTTNTITVGGITSNGIIKTGTYVTAPTVQNGGHYYNSTTGKNYFGEDGTWKDVFGQNTISGKTILVDKDNPNATDTRGTLSKYNHTYPWKTINAALAAVALGDNVDIRNGTYSERVSFTGTFPTNVTVTIQNATILSWTTSNVGLNITGLGTASIDTIYYSNSALYSGLTSIKVVKPAAGGSAGYFRNIYSIDSIDCNSSVAAEFYNINNIRTARVGPMSKFYNCRIIATTGAGIAVRNATAVTSSVNDCAFVECYIYGATYGIYMGNLSGKIKILDSEVYGGVHAIYSGDSFTATPTLRIMNTLLRGPGDAVRAGAATHTVTMETSNVTRTGGYGGTGTFTHSFQNNDIQYTGL